MGYTKRNGTYVHTVDVDLSPSAALSADSTTSGVELGNLGTLRLTLNVTAVSASDSLDVSIETSRDGTTWYTAGAFTQATGTTTESKCFPVDRFVRAKYDVTGAAISISCTLRGEAV